jgi:uncharacterized protein involved in exopolysaccharide biosynthesis
MEQEHEIDVLSAFWAVWDQKYLVLAISLLGGVIAAIFALTAVPIYQAQVTVTEVSDTAMSGASSLMGQLGSLASVAGLNLNTNGSDAERPAVLQSRALIAAFVNKYKLAPLLQRKSEHTQSEWLAVERFRESVFDLHEDKLKGTTTISILWRDPAVAARWANDIVGLANEMLRTRAIQESTRNIEYLNEQLKKTTVVEIQRVMYSLIENETKSLMLAQGRIEYAFAVVDPAVAPEIRYSPRRTLWVISGLFAGGFLGSLFVWVRNAIRRHRPVTATN